MITTEAPGKVILLGEYAVLYGATALVAAINRTARVHIEADTQFSLHAFGTRFRARDTETLRHTDSRLELVACVLDEIFGPGELPTLRVETQTDSFFEGEQKLGLGSSAAVAVALAEALRLHRGEHPGSDMLFRDAYRAHRRSQGGVGSGIDIAASAYGGVIAYRAPRPGGDMPERVDALRWPAELTWEVSFVGSSASTPKLVAALHELEARTPARARECLGVLTEATERGVEAFSMGRLDAFLRAVGDFRAGLESLGDAAGSDIMSEAHRAQASVAAELGAVYKPSGAGGGDIGVAFSKRTERRAQANALPMTLHPTRSSR